MHLFGERSQDTEPFLEQNVSSDAILLDPDLEKSQKEEYENFRAGQPSVARLAFTAVFAALFLFTTIFLGVYKGNSGSDAVVSKKPISLEDLQNNVFNIKRTQLNWIPQVGDGVYSFIGGDRSILITDVTGNSTSTLVGGDEIVDSENRRLDWSDFTVSSDKKYVLLRANTVKQWRHSRLSNFYVFDLETRKNVPLREPLAKPQTATAIFSPRGTHIAYVHENDLYITKTGSLDDVIRITDNAGPTLFNGICDWVYEEEVLLTGDALWWSPNGENLIFLSFNETDVPEYEYPIYNGDYSLDHPGAVPYPEQVHMRYPKPGYPNPFVDVNMFQLRAWDPSVRASTKFEDPKSSNERDVLPRQDDVSSKSPAAILSQGLTSFKFDKPFPADDVIISEVAWTSPADIIIKATNRIGSQLRVSHFHLPYTFRGTQVEGKTTREESYEDGWVEQVSPIYGLQAKFTENSFFAGHDPNADMPVDAYLDVVPDAHGYNHIALFAPISSSKPQFLTTGEWEVNGPILHVDSEEMRVYFSAATTSPTEKYLMSARIAVGASQVTDIQVHNAPVDEKGNPSDPSVYSATFSPLGGFYVLDYNGPLAPWQELHRTVDHSVVSKLSDNSDLTAVEANYALPETRFLSIDTGNVTIYASELLPPDFNPAAKYPVLVRVYGGPASNMVSHAYLRDWHAFLASNLSYIVLTIDGRGTGLRGRDYRMPVYKHLGVFESQDAVDAARVYRDTHRYVDGKKIGIWGWSYGGFLTAKVIERNSGVYSLGMSVAPVTDFRLYDSVYTERYMQTPQTNEDGYNGAAVSDMEGFKNANYLLAHGSGDDNVHFANTAGLLDKFTVAHVRGFEFRQFTDSDHGIRTREAYWELMTWLTDFLQRKWG